MLVGSVRRAVDWAAEEGVREISIWDDRGEHDLPVEPMVRDTNEV